MLVCPFAKFTFLLLDGQFSAKLLLPTGKGGQQQGPMISCNENNQLWQPILAKCATSYPFKI
jgi:hypothetical protein